MIWSISAFVVFYSVRPSKLIVDTRWRIICEDSMISAIGVLTSAHARRRKVIDTLADEIIGLFVIHSAGRRACEVAANRALSGRGQVSRACIDLTN